MAEGLLRSELYLETGHPDEAAEVLEEQRRRVVDFHGRLRDVLVAAAAEAEAEAVLSGARGVEALHDRGPAVSRFPQLVAASLVLVLGVAMAGTWTASHEGSLRAAVRIDSTDELDTTERDVVAAAPRPDRRRPGDPRSGLTGAERAERDPAGDQAATRRWLAQQGSLLQRLGAGIRVRSEVLRELEGLVATLAPGTPLADQMWLQVLSEAVAAGSEAAERDAAETDPPAEDAEGGAASGDDDRERSWFRRSVDQGEQDAEAEPVDGEPGDGEPGTGEAPGGDTPTAPQPAGDADGGQDGGESGSSTADGDTSGARSGEAGTLIGSSE